MNVLVSILLAVLLAAALTWLALRQPLRLEIRWGTDEKRFLWSWLGFVSERDTQSKTSTLRWRDWRLRSSVWQPKQEKPKEPPKPRRRRRTRWWRRPDLVREVISALWSGIRLFFERLRVERCKARIQIATPDPALTGTLYGYATAMRHMLAPWLPNMQLELQPDFENEQPKVQGEICLSIRPTDIIRAGVRVVRTLPKRKLWQALRASRRERDIEGGGSRDGTQRIAQNIGG